MRKLALGIMIFLFSSLGLIAQNEVEGDSIIIGHFSQYREPIKWGKPKKGLVYEYDNLQEKNPHSLGIVYHYDWDKLSANSYWESNSYQLSCFLLSNGNSVNLRIENFPTLIGEQDSENIGKLSFITEIKYDRENKWSIYGETPDIIGLSYVFSFRGSFGINSRDYRVNGNSIWYNSLPKNWFSLRIETPIPLKFKKIISLTRITWVEGVFDEYMTAASWISTEIRWGRVEMKGSLTKFWDNASGFPPKNLVGNISIRIFFL